MAFAVPRKFFPAVGGRQLAELRGALNILTHQLQGGAVGDDYDEPIPIIDLVPTTNVPFPAAEMFFGETVESVRVLMQKPCRFLVQFSTTTDGVKTFLMWPLVALPYGDNTKDDGFIGTQRIFTYEAWYRAMFTGVTGSRRLKFFPASDCWIGAAAEYIATNGINNVYGTGGGGGESANKSFVNTMCPMSFSGPQRGHEVLIPNYSQWKFLPGWHDPGSEQRSWYGNCDNVSIAGASAVATPPEVITYHCMGPDVRLVGFRQVPEIGPEGTRTFKQWFA
jgi:hypothetical protein